MDGLLDQIGTLLTGIFALAEGGFDGVNQVLGLIIAAIAAILMASWGRLFPTALAAAFIHVVINVVRPVLDGGAFVLPDILTLGFWMALFALFLGSAIVIALLFFLKSLIFGRRHAHAHCSERGCGRRDRAAPHLLAPGRVKAAADDQGRSGQRRPRGRNR